jgi:hypothetical protein
MEKFERKKEKNIENLLRYDKVVDPDPCGSGFDLIMVDGSGSRKAKNCIFCFSWRATECWPLLCLCRPFCIFRRYVDSNPENCNSKQVRYQLCNPFPRKKEKK